MRKVIASIDMGSNSLKLVVGEFLRQKLNILAVSECMSEGIQNGFVTDPELVIDSLKNVFEKAEAMVGLPIRKVITSVPSQQSSFIISEGYTTINNPEGIIRNADIIRAMQAASYNQISADEELASIIPINFKINDEEIVSSPLNLHAENLKVKTVLVTVPKQNVYPLIKCLEKLGIEVLDIALTSLGDYACLKNNTTKNEVGCFINIGSDTTTISIFNKGVLLNTEVLELGGKNIDKDLAYVYKLTKSDAKNIKERLCLAHNRLANPANKMELTNKLGETISVDQYEASSISESRLEEILKLAKKEINLLTKKEIHYIMITGGVTEMPDFSLVVESVFGHNAKIASVTDLGARNNKYSTAVGLIKYYENKLRLRNKEFSIFNLEEQEELGGVDRKINFSDNSVLGKLFGYFFDN